MKTQRHSLPIEEQVFLLAFAEGDLADRLRRGRRRSCASIPRVRRGTSRGPPILDRRAGAPGGIQAFLHEVEMWYFFGFMNDGWRVYSGVCAAMKGR
jgi:hypothetical protein